MRTANDFAGPPDSQRTAILLQLPKSACDTITEHTTHDNLAEENPGVLLRVHSDLKLGSVFHFVSFSSVGPFGAARRPGLDNAGPPTFRTTRPSRTGRNLKLHLIGISRIGLPYTNIRGRKAGLGLSRESLLLTAVTSHSPAVDRPIAACHVRHLCSHQ